MIGRALTLSSLLVVCAAGSELLAQEPVAEIAPMGPAGAQLVLVLESSDPDTTAPELRTRLATVLGRPVGALTSTRPERLVIVRLGPTGPAHVRIEGRGRTPRIQSIARADGDWLVRGLYGALSTVLVDWEGRPRSVRSVALADWDEGDHPFDLAESADGLDPPPR